MMKFHLLLLSALVPGLQIHGAVSNLDDLNYWGSGSNRTAVVVNWNDGKTPSALAWGYRWSGSATVADMMLGIAASDPSFFLRVDSQSSLGLAIFGIGYQNGENEFGVTGAVDADGNPVTPAFTDGVSDLNVSPTATEAPFSQASAGPLNPTDRYAEGWSDNGFWEMFHSGNSNSELQASVSFPTAWTSSFVGSSLLLVDTAWVAFSLSEPDFTSNPPAGASNTVAAVPEPGSVGILFGFVAGIAFFRRKRHR